jgi:hypothetical protein
MNGVDRAMIAMSIGAFFAWMCIVSVKLDHIQKSLDLIASPRPTTSIVYDSPPRVIVVK